MIMETKFSTLVFIETLDPEYKFGHVTMLDKAVMSGTVPQILLSGHTIESLGRVFPHIDFTNTEVVEIEIKYNK
jgi:hypothetical protein